MKLYHYSKTPYTELRSKRAQGKVSQAEIKDAEEARAFRRSVSLDIDEISFLPDPAPLEILGQLYANHNHHIWVPNATIYEHIVESRDLPDFIYHITETPGDIEQMNTEWDAMFVKGKSNAEIIRSKQEYFANKTKRKNQTGENGSGNIALEKNMRKYVGKTKQAYLDAIPLFDDYNWKQYAPFVPHVQLDIEGGIAKLLRPARAVKVGGAIGKYTTESKTLPSLHW